MGRSAISMQVKRDVLVEAGHRCAIPTCHHTTIETAHIIPIKKGGKDTFDNLIALCPNCHTRYDKNEIDRKAMRQYKANLSILNGRYGDLEQRVLRYFADNPSEDTIRFPDSFEILLSYLQEDNLIEEIHRQRAMVIEPTLIPSSVVYRITPKGREFVEKWISAKTLD